MLGTNEASNLFRQTYPRGMLVFFYGFIWIIAALAGYILLDSFVAPDNSVGMILVTATVTSALAGAVGGATAMLSRLHQHMSISQNFQNQSLGSYLLQPVIGIVVGVIVLYLIVILPALLFNYAIHREFLFVETVTSPVFVALQILLSWTGGFYQRQGLEQIKSLTKSDTIPELEPEDFDEDAPFHFKDVYTYQRNMFRWSYTWGLFIFFYGIFWLVILTVTYLMASDLFATLEAGSHTTAAALILAAWPAAAAGGMGGTFGLFKDLYNHVSIKQDFHRQHLMSYLVQPIVGFMLGFLMYFLLASGFLAISNDDGSTMAVGSGAVIMLQLLLGWIAGFRQQTVTDLIQRLIQSLISIFKRLGRKLMSNPLGWFKKAERDKILADIAEEQERSVFSSIDPDDPPDFVWHRRG